LEQTADGVATLPASQAIIHGAKLNYETGGSKDNLGYWIDPADWAEWEFKVVRPGKVRVTAEIAALGTGSFDLKIDGQTLRGTAPNTGDYGKFQTVDLGIVDLDRIGKTTLSVRPVVEGWQPLNLKSITLKPAG
jgi:hypothetical protein